MAFFHIKPATRKFKPVEDLPQHFEFFDASSESLTLIGVDITRENLHQGLPGVRVCVCVCLSVCLSACLPVFMEMLGGGSGEGREPEWPQLGGDACLEDVEGFCWAAVQAHAT